MSTSGPDTASRRRASDVLLDGLARLEGHASLSAMLDAVCATVVAVGDFRAAMLTFYMGDVVGHGIAGDFPEGTRERFSAMHRRGTPERRRRRRGELWAHRAPDTNIVFIPEGSGPPVSQAFVPSEDTGGTWRPGDRLMIMFPGRSAALLHDDLFAVLSLDKPVTANRPDDEVMRRLRLVERFVEVVTLHVENRLMRERVLASEQQHRRVLEALPSTVLLVARDGRVLGGSSGCGRGALPALAASASLGDVAWSEELAHALRRLLEHGEALPATESRVTVAGRPVDVLLRGTPLPVVGDDAESPQPVAVLAVEDVTTLRDMQRRARDGEKMHAIGRLANGVAHEFNNMLTSVIGALSLALSTPAVRDDEGVAGLLENARAAAERGASLTRQLQAFARPPSTMAVDAVDLPAVCERVLALVERTVDPRIHVELDPAGPIPPVAGDAALLEHLLLHVVSNSCDALAVRLRTRTSSDAFEASVRVRVAPREYAVSGGAGRSVELVVSDNGCGMDAETLRRAFEPFFSGDPAGRHPGIGLTLAEGIARQHGGALELRSRLGEGTTFRVVLPCWEGAVDEGVAPLSVQRGCVLIVDDDLLILEVVEQMLATAGFTSVSVSSGAAAIERLSAEPERYQAVVLDYSMPGLSGEETLRRLRDDGVRVPPVILSSGDPSRFEDSDLGALGVVGCVPKPYRPDALVDALDRANR